MPSDSEVEQFGQRIDAIPDLEGAGIGFVGSELVSIGFNCVGAVLAYSAMGGEDLAAGASGGT